MGTLTAGWWPVTSRFARAYTPATLTRCSAVLFDTCFRIGAGPLPAKDLRLRLQCAIAAREDLDSGLDGAVRVCFVQD